MGLSLRSSTPFAFWLIIVFVIAQVTWWMIFQQNLVRKVNEETLQNWGRDARTLEGLLQEGVSDVYFDTLLRQYSYLQREGEDISIRPEALAASAAEQQSSLRMFAFEGPFFVLVILLGLFILYRNLKAERLLKMQQQNFLSAITHEFKTPIATLRLLIQTAERRLHKPEQQLGYLQKMQSELSRLEQTTSQVLAAARLDQGNSPPQLACYDLNRVVADITEQALAGLEARGAELQLSLSNKALFVTLDPQAFSVVLNNLLDNAIKYSPAPRKPIVVGVQELEHHCTVYVEDRGVGVAAQDSEQIFEKFYRAGNELTRSSKGIGLGLYLVKHISEAMNGWVRCEALPQGSRFSVMLPKAVMSKVASKESSKASEQGAQQPHYRLS